MSVTPNTSMWINIVIAVLGVISAGALPHFIPSAIGGDITEAASFAIAIISAINAALHGTSAPQPGPLAGGKP